jgi:hypothetical protein
MRHMRHSSTGTAATAPRHAACTATADARRRAPLLRKRAPLGNPPSDVVSQGPARIVENRTAHGGDATKGQSQGQTEGQKLDRRTGNTIRSVIPLIEPAARTGDADELATTDLEVNLVDNNPWIG